MPSIQIPLSHEQVSRAEARAEQLGLSLAEYIGWLIARELGEEREAVDVSAIFNLGDSGGSDFARDKDEMLGEAFEASRRACAPPGAK